jgi:hypothetical protein
MSTRGLTGPTIAHNVLCEWREADAGRSTVARVVRRQARTADLVIALQTPSKRKGSPDMVIADRLALETVRPVLIVPQPISRRIVVGWIDRREAVRAVFDALPSLTKAELLVMGCYGHSDFANLYWVVPVGMYWRT